MDPRDAGQESFQEGAYMISEVDIKRQKQERHYTMLSQLQDMARQIPMNFQQRLPYTTISNLALSLLDGTVFEIVQHLSEIQQMMERKLMEQRARLHSSHKSQKYQMQKKHQVAIQDSQSRPHNIPRIKATNEKEKEALDKKIFEEAKRMDERILIELDTCAAEQQTTLEKAGVPGFRRTHDSTECKLQMYILEFITKLHRMEMAETGS
ncbi:protein DGCR6-like [Lytechinus variegatus]|uniref:protein DGCR6-like n=1 Tax=Lytechinus variegatus TaxID=7654 RepID=UPI001BB118C3|nr:protein DGCR6-like [Lytechinus variegatus]XP_041462249.1 protein DGCR6-like [Lytechinus variegatus]XP_041462251.1 protein DGCR6-like [Lytechinus variegatus]XP_041462343.1 protein DGCR6-like [Lytechinus variegatus]XP_041462344.1 protein DGCR6-like [Lytechinus variegatus]